MILIVAPAGDLHARAVAHELTAHGAPVYGLDFGDFDDGLRLTETITSRRLDGELRLPTGEALRLSEIETIWWRRPRMPEIDGDFGQATTYVESEWRHLLEGLEAVVSARWVNSPSANRRAARKAFGLAAAIREGLRVPQTAITNDPDAVRELMGEGRPLIYKRIGTAGGPTTATMPFGLGDVARLDTLTNCPAIFQERIDARLDIRVTAFGEDLHAAEIHSQEGDGSLDWRLDHGVPFCPHALDSAVERALRGVMIRLGLEFGAFDLRLTPEGEYVFLEVNPSGQFLFLELLAEMPLSARMAEFLSQPAHIRG
jgi:glutathione synthase/RimK-type ligase-like ATP-grasp enzyme